MLPLFFIPICLYIHKVVTLFSGKKVTICIYIYIFIHSFFGSHNPPPNQKHIINESHGFATFFAKFAGSSHGPTMAIKSLQGRGRNLTQTAKTHQSQLLKASHQSTKHRLYRIYIWCIYLHYGEKIGYFQGEMQAKNIFQGCQISAPNGLFW